MLLNLFFLFLLLFFLFLLSRKISLNIYRSAYIISKSKNFSLGVLLVFQLPGTIIHELSHFLVASLMRARVRELTILPKVDENGEVKAGRLVYDALDPFRQILIGLAPMTVGLTLIYLIGRYFFPYVSQPTTYNPSTLLGASLQPTTLLGFYLLFITSFTMFSSRKDIESLIIVGPIILVVVSSLYLTGVRIYFEKSLTEKLSTSVSELNYYLLLTTVLDFLILVILLANLYFWQKIFKKTT